MEENIVRYFLPLNGDNVQIVESILYLNLCKADHSENRKKFALSATEFAKKMFALNKRNWVVCIYWKAKKSWKI